MGPPAFLGSVPTSPGAKRALRTRAFCTGWPCPAAGITGPRAEWGRPASPPGLRPGRGRMARRAQEGSVSNSPASLLSRDTSARSRPRLGESRTRDTQGAPLCGSVGDAEGWGQGLAQPAAPPETSGQPRPPPASVSPSAPWTVKQSETLANGSPCAGPDRTPRPALCHLGHSGPFLVQKIAT